MKTKNRYWLTAALAVTLVAGVWITPAQADHRERGGLLGAILDGITRDDHDDHHFRGDKGKGPAFCRSGAGHPVHGRRWCHEKGFGLGHSRHRDRDRDLGDVVEDVILGR